MYLSEIGTIDSVFCKASNEDFSIKCMIALMLYHLGSSKDFTPPKICERREKAVNMTNIFITDFKSELIF